jgi:hypothetical protein
MKNRGAKNQSWTFKARGFLAFAGVLVMGLGIVTFLQRKLLYQNYWHAPVFAPFAVGLGALTFIIAIIGKRF